jgi:2-polyprenyl-3-methyl-5-hydroxy-6-metoxy-1,4-benzoquinol methylase
MAEDKYYKHLDYENRSRDPYANAKYMLIMKWLPKENNLRVLNAGCGSGEMNNLLSKNESWSVDAIDTDDKAIEMSRSINRSNLRVIQTSIEEYEPDKAYDIITCSDVLEHIEDDVRAIKKLNLLLKPGGILYVSVPAMQGLFGYHDEMLGHYRRYSRKELREKLSLCFEVERCRYFAASLIPVVLLYSKILRKPYFEEGREGQGGTGRSARVRTPISHKLLGLILRVESAIHMPLGISLLAAARKWKSEVSEEFGQQGFLAAAGGHHDGINVKP